MKRDRTAERRTAVALKLWGFTQRNHKNVTWEELGVPFQWCGVLDLRDRGVVAGTNDGGKSCVYLKEPYASMTMLEFSREIKTMFGQKIYGK